MRSAAPQHTRDTRFYTAGRIIKNGRLHAK
jgi:hypothetical protein